MIRARPSVESGEGTVGSFPRRERSAGAGGNAADTRYRCPGLGKRTFSRGVAGDRGARPPPCKAGAEERYYGLRENPERWPRYCTRVPPAGTVRWMSAGRPVRSSCAGTAGSVSTVTTNVSLSPPRGTPGSAPGTSGRPGGSTRGSCSLGRVSELPSAGSLARPCRSDHRAPPTSLGTRGWRGPG